MRTMRNSSNNREQKMEQDPLGLFERAQIPWKKSSDDIWAGMENNMDETAKVYKINRGRMFIRFAVAAAVVIFFGIPSLMRFYTKTIESGRSEHLDVTLPDGSSISLNAQTAVKYHPFWWRFKRDVKLDGEAYFEVVKGKDFVVKSEMASTAVLGTSFNIFSRGSRYEVTCLTGKVMVFAADENSKVFLVPDQKAVLETSGMLITESGISADQSISWTDDEFFFTSVSLESVFREIERQYGIIITSDIGDNLLYTGNFSRNQDIEVILDLVCKPFGIKFEKTKEETYLVSKDE